MITLANVRVQKVAIYISLIFHKQNSQIPRQLLTLNDCQALMFLYYMRKSLYSGFRSLIISSPRSTHQTSPIDLL